VNVYDSGTQIGRVREEEALVDVALGREFGTWGELRFGVRRGTDEPELKTGDPAAILLEDFDRGEAFARFTVDTLDSIYFPTGGNLLHAEWLTSQHDMNATVEFDQFAGDFVTAHTFGRHTVVFGLRYGSTTEGVAPPSNLFEMGGFWDLSGFAQDELSGQNVGGLLASYYRRLGNLGRRMPIYGGISLEKGNVWETRDEISLGNSISAGSLWLGADTPIGPLYLAYGRAEGDRESFYIVIGNVVD
jgi:NTE family protein